MASKMTRTFVGMAIVLAAGAIVGCNSTLVGTWKTDPMPKDAPFVIQQVTFKDDNTYTASAKENDQNVRLAGTFDFNGFQLRLKTPQKPDRSYGATVIMGRTLELKSGDKKISMKKQ